MTQEEGELAGPLWVTGGIPVDALGRPAVRDAQPHDALPLRPLQAKPLCDGTHREIDFRERSEAAAAAARWPRRRAPAQACG